MKDFKSYIILGLCILLVYFIFSGNKNAVDQVRLESLEQQKKAAMRQLSALKVKTETDSLNFIEHLRQDSINSIDTERLERSLTKARADYKEAVERNKVVFRLDQEQLDSAFRKLYPIEDLNH